MKYVLAIAYGIIGILLLFDVIEIQSTNAIYATIFFSLARLFLNEGHED